ncbi:allene oxide cyclase [Klebsormidium nitens]|uniref:Dirigent protein n=1 Tax=Klebsormidium nitens TaxID=105231 RepID=A0A1Y1IG87_KLENI|nr:allene oxide cyclase [Klebsormidium nitens]|eukprot:GAQ88519.1 allene oxide cyclase [Klebsormidium nitens]
MAQAEKGMLRCPRCRLLLVLLLALLASPVQSGTARLEFAEHNLQLTEATTPLSQKVSGRSFGDSIIFRNPLLDFNTMENVGHTEGVCIYTVARDVTGGYELECDFTCVLDKGTFTVTGQWTDAPSAMAVVGGTGIYSGATGVVQQSRLKHDKATGADLFGLNIRIYALPEIQLKPLGPHDSESGVIV